MSQRETVARYNLIIQKLRNHKQATFSEIAEYLERQSEIDERNYSVSARTFQRDVAAIFELYKIEIKYDFSRKVYYIDTDAQDEANSRIMEAFDMLNALNASDKLSNYIHFDKRKPQGSENLYGILHAVKNRLQIAFTYQKFWEDTPTTRTAQPYALKEFKNRWYVLVRDLKDDNVKTFALDRLTDLEITKKKFLIPKEFSANEYFKHCFGVERPNDAQPQEIILSFDEEQGKYIKTLPLHTSQEIITDTKEELRVKLFVYDTYDLRMELLSFGERVKIISPKSLVNKMKKVAEEVLGQY